MPQGEVAPPAGGCCWCLEAAFQQLQGVEQVRSGYAGGHVANPSYEDVCTGTTGHAEVVQITFDPSVVSFDELLHVFFTIHDPTTLNRQGGDVGTQYRSAIFHHSPEQKAAAASVAQGAPPAGSTEPFVVEYYYKVRWGFADEFIRLFKKNHFPVLKRQIELGHAQQVTAEAPRFHGTEDGRWDYRVTIVWKNAAAPHEPFPEAELKRLFPDQDTFRREEQRRFEILAAHWDLPVVSVDLTRP